MLSKVTEWHSDMLRRLAIINFTYPGLLFEISGTLESTRIPRCRVNLELPLKKVVLEIRPPMDLWPLRYSSIYRSASKPDVLVEFRYFEKPMFDDAFNELKGNVYGIVRMLKSADSRLMKILTCSVYIWPNLTYDLNYNISCLQI